MAYTTIDDPTIYFNTKLYTGNGSTQSITGVDHQPDFVWIKNRTTNFGSRLLDSVRGATKELFSNATSSENTNTDSLTSFDSDGFSLGSHGGVNENSSSFVSWNWKAGGTASSNTDGSITSTVSVNTTSGFSIVSYTGNVTSGATVGHGLGTTPAVIIVKKRSGSDGWVVYHHRNTSAPETEYLRLDTTAATTDNLGEWNDTAPSPTVFTIGNSGRTNDNGATYIAYCFAEKKGFSKFGSYTGNGNADGSFIYTGFKPAMIMFKKTDAAGSWYIKDNQRSGTTDLQNFGQMNPNQTQYPSADTNFVENKTSGYAMDILSNGFKARGTDSGINTSGGNYIYISFAEQPLVTSTGIPTTAR